MRPLLLSALLLLSGHTQASEWNDSQAVDKLFGAAGVKGTFVLYDVQRQRYVGHDRERAETRFVPASTYKVANSLIGLSTGAVRSADEVLPYGGKPQRFKAWEHDMSLREAIKASNVPVYQELARRIGLERMRANVSRLGYGNAEIGQVVDNFWLVGPLKISAMEQTHFLLRLAQGELPFPAPVQSTVRAMTLLESGPGWELHGKTGWCFDCTPELGWWVGWVKRNERLYGFALTSTCPAARPTSASASNWARPVSRLSGYCPDALPPQSPTFFCRDCRHSSRRITSALCTGGLSTSAAASKRCGANSMAPR